MIGRDDPADTVAAFYSGLLIAAGGVLQQIAWATSNNTLGNFTIGILILGAIGYIAGRPALAAAERRGIIAPATAAPPNRATLARLQRTWGTITAIAALVAVVAAAVSLYTGWWWGIAIAGLGTGITAGNTFTYRRTQLAAASETGAS